MVSPLGYAPYGGRSNLFVHNEAMVVYLCEFEARRWRERDPALAGRFRAVARQALAMVAGFAALTPPRNLKNRFHPSSKHGRDTGYGEYGVYSLLGASLLARAYLVADDTIPVADCWQGKTGNILYLEPAFHRLFASVGDTFLQLDTCGQPGHDATGLGRFHRLGVPAPLGGSLSVAASPKYIVGTCATDRNAAIGPGWRDGTGTWQWLADCAERVAKVELCGSRAAANRVEWELLHTLDGAGARSVRQRFSLTPGRLTIEAEVTPSVSEIGFMVPCLRTDGETEACVSAGDQEVTVDFQGARLRAAMATASGVSIDPTLRASREAIYRIAEFHAPGSHGTLELELTPNGQ